MSDTKIKSFLTSLSLFGPLERIFVFQPNSCRACLLIKKSKARQISDSIIYSSDRCYAWEGIFFLKVPFKFWYRTFIQIRWAFSLVFLFYIKPWYKEKLELDCFGLRSYFFAIISIYNPSFSGSLWNSRSWTLIWRKYSPCLNKSS